MRNIITLADAETLFGPYFEPISDCIMDGAGDYIEMVRHENEQQGRRTKFNARTKASLLHDYVTTRLTARFSETENISILDPANGVFTMSFHGQVISRIKKLGRDLRPSNIQTKRTKDYNRQYSIDGLADEPTLLYIGYTTNSTYTSIDGIYIVCWIGAQVQWYIDITEKIGAEQTSLRFVPQAVVEQETTEKVARVKVKPEIAAAKKKPSTQ